MISFDKKIAYLDYIECGTRKKSAGFVKMEVRNGECRIQVKVQGLYQTDTMRCDLMLLGKTGTHLLDTFVLQSGTGTYLAIFPADNIGGSGWSYEEIRGVRILLSTSRYLHTEWKMPESREREEAVEKHTEHEAHSMVEKPADKDIEDEDIEDKENRGLEESESGLQQEKVKEIHVQGICDDKWAQLEQTYPKIHPFGNETEYLSIEPKDFIILTGHYQHLANNSFLLHGFYNYRHLILGRKHNQVYYIGVPGAFYEREKMVALMFGFESFESAVEPPEQGGFGYYMKRVEI